MDAAVAETTSPTRDEIIREGAVEALFQGEFVIYEKDGKHYMCDFSTDEHGFDAFFNDSTGCSDGMSYEDLAKEFERVGAEWLDEKLPEYAE